MEPDSSEDRWPEGPYRDRGLRPIPDPTTLTTQQLTREIASLKELVFVRLDAMDKALMVFTENLTRVPTDVDKQVTALREVVYESLKTYDGLFKAIDIRFLERDKRAEQAAECSSTAVAAALQAQKDSVAAHNESSAVAIAKAEATTTKQIDQIHILLQTANTGLESKITDIKDRLTIIEGKTLGQATAHETRDARQGQWVSIISIMVGALLSLGGLFLAFSSSPAPPQVVERVIVNPPASNNGGRP